MLITAIDPGPSKSGWCVFEPSGQAGLVHDCGTGTPNDHLAEQLPALADYTDVLVIEEVAHYGMAVGATVFGTCRWSGIFARSYTPKPLHVHWMTFLQVKMELCHDSRAKETNVRQAVRDLFPKTGRNGRKEPTEIGTKLSPGPLHHVKGHAWSALALAIAWNIREGRN